MNEQMMELIRKLPPEQQALMLQEFSQGQEQEAPMAQAPMVDPKMGMPGMNNATPQPQMPGGADTFRDFTGEGGVIADQQAQAEALRGESTPQGINTNNAGYIAASPLSHLATGVNRIRGGINAREALQAKTDLSKALGASDKENMDKEFTRKQEIQADIMRRNRQGKESINPLEQMANNQGKQVFA